MEKSLLDISVKQSFDNYMNLEHQDCTSELIKSEQLHSFSVVELYCQSCDRTTAHQIDDEQSDIHICVTCRKDEEEKLEF